VEGFAIGGHCQYLLLMDYVLAARDAYLTLARAQEASSPARPNLRQHAALVGDRIARQAVMAELRIECDARGAADLRRGLAQSEMDGRHPSAW